jgi:hypothetical protein
VIDVVTEIPEAVFVAVGTPPNVTDARAAALSSGCHLGQMLVRVAVGVAVEGAVPWPCAGCRVRAIRATLFAATLFAATPFAATAVAFTGKRRRAKRVS